MAGVKTCGAHCQHPTCWASGKDEMIEAYKRMGLIAQTGRSGYSNSRPSDIEQSKSRYQQIHFDNEEDSREAALPTLKIVNIFEKDEKQDDDGDHRSSAYVFHLYNSKRESSFPVSSAATRSSKLPKAPCASPSPSFVSQYFKKQGKMVTKKWTIDEYEEEGTDFVDTVQATNVKIQGKEITTEKEYTPTFVPYLVWIPSKKKKKRKKCRSADRSNQVSMKNITGSNSDFGYLPNDKDVSLRCYSRARHTVRSSPSKLHPKKLPPLPRDASERLRSPTYEPVWNESNEMLLSGNSLSRLNKQTLPSKAVTPVLMSLNTPHNTRASVRTRGNTQRKISELPKEECKIMENENDDDLCISSNETLVIHPEVDVRIERAQTLKGFTRYENEARLHLKDVKEHREHREQRAELFLPRVTVPKDQLRRLPVGDHCKNSVPSHYLHDIQMQPVYGTDKTVSQISSASLRENASHLSEGDVNWTRELMEVESQITEEEYVKIFETVVKEKRGQLSSEEVNWERDVLRAPAPTPSSPRKLLEHVLSSKFDVIEAVREEQNHGDARQYEKFINETRPLVDPVSEAVSLAEFRIAKEAESRGSKATSITVSPVPSKTSSGDWPSDKEFIKQTYDQYRSFTPFKMPSVSLMDTRLESIREFSREQTCMTEKEKSTMLKGTVRVNSLPFDARIIPDFFSNESLNKQMKAKALANKSSHHLTPTSRSRIMQRRSQGDVASEHSVNTMTPREQQLRSKYSYGPTLSVKRMALQDPVTKQKHDYVSSYEIYETSLDMQKAVMPIIIPIPHPTPCESCNEEDHKNAVITKDENRTSHLIAKDVDGKDALLTKHENCTGHVVTNNSDREDAVIAENEHRTEHETTIDGDRKDDVITKDENRTGHVTTIGGDRKDAVITKDENRTGYVITSDGDHKDTVVTNKSDEAQDSSVNETAADFKNSGKKPDEMRKETNFSNKNEVNLDIQNESSNFDQNSNDGERMEDLKEAGLDDDLVNHETKGSDISYSNPENVSSSKNRILMPSFNAERDEITDSHDRAGIEDLREPDSNDDYLNNELPGKSKAKWADNSHIIEEFRHENSCSRITLTARPVMYTDLDELTNVGSNFDYSEYDLSMDLNENVISDFSMDLDLSIDLDEIKNAMAELYDIDEK